jgi:alkylhydroperoxidase/carboxymuconolactone decarboxylase family protein YurZ
MTETTIAIAPRELLRRLAAGDEDSLRAVLQSAPDLADDHAAGGSMLDRRTRLLVRLGALLVLDAPTDSVRWATELASTAGAGEDALAAVLLATGPTAGSAQLVASASRLAAALDLEPDTPDRAQPVTDQAALPPQRGRRPRTGRPLRACGRPRGPGS